MFNAKAQMTRLTAIAVVAFMVLGAGRGFVPKLCLTLSSLASIESASGSDCEIGARTCCSAKGSDPAKAPARGENPSCALCHVAKAIFQTQAAVTLTTPVRHTTQVEALPCAAWLNPVSWNTPAGRAPPSNLSV
jgi:hypothetical protein